MDASSVSTLHLSLFFFFNDTATTEIYTLSLHDALPICTVRFGDIKRGKREIYVHPEEGEPQLYEVPAGKHLRVHEGDRVRAGDRLTEGPVNPHDILRIKGPRAVQEYLLNEVQEVYRLQGVKINDKHIGVIVRQM